MSDEKNINQITLRYFTNPTYQPSILGNSSDSISNEDIRFYRKRIISLTKDLFRQPAPNESIKDAFYGYIVSAINHLKMVDTHDVLQTEYVDMSAAVALSASTTSSYFDDDSKDILDEANSSMMKQIQYGNTLDSFVTSTRSKNNDVIPPPKLKCVNLQAPELKINGVKRKKKKM